MSRIHEHRGSRSVLRVLLATAAFLAAAAAIPALGAAADFLPPLPVGFDAVAMNSSQNGSGDVVLAWYSANYKISYAIRHNGVWGPTLKGPNTGRNATGYDLTAVIDNSDNLTFIWQSDAS